MATLRVLGLTSGVLSLSKTPEKQRIVRIRPGVTDPDTDPELACIDGRFGRVRFRGVLTEPRVPSSARVVEDLTQFACEGLGLAGVTELAAEEAAVVAGEHRCPHSEQLCRRH